MSPPRERAATRGRGTVPSASSPVPRLASMLPVRPGRDRRTPRRLRLRPRPASTHPARPPVTTGRHLAPVALSDPATLGIIAHELRTPITTLAVGSRLLQGERLPEAARGEVVDALVVETERLRTFVEDLIALAASAGPPDRAVQPVLLQRTIPAIVASETARRPELRIRAQVARDLPPAIADDAAVERTIRTLLGAAVELGAPGELDLVARVEGRRVVVRILVAPADATEASARDLFDPAILPGSADGASSRVRFGLAAASATARRLGGAAWGRAIGGRLELGLALPFVRGEDRAGGRDGLVPLVRPE